MVQEIRYRISQALLAMTAFARPVDEAAAAALLGPDLLPLFRRMRRSEQLHSLRVMAMLRGRGHSESALLVAALLHDCGKSRYSFGFIDRVLVVMVRRLAPGPYARWSAAAPAGWKRPFVIAEQHPVWSAEEMATLGADPLAVELARRHAEKLPGPPRDTAERLLLALQQADDSN